MIAVLLLAAGLMGAAGFVGLYTWWAPWWRTEVGQWLVTLPSALGLLLANGLIYRIGWDYAGRKVVNLVLFVVVVASVWWSLALLIRVIRRYPKRRRPVRRRADQP